MARACSVCSRTDSDAIEAAIREGKSQRAVAKLFPPVTAAAIQRHMIHARRPSGSSSGNPPSGNARPPADFLEEKARLTQAQADLAELQLAQKRGELLELAAVEQTWTDIIARIRAKVRGLPRKVAPLLIGLSSPDQAETLLSAETDNLLLDLSSDDLN